VPPEPAITDAERGRFTQFHGPTSQVYSCVLPGEIVRNCAQAVASGQIDVAEILGIEHLIVDEYQDLNPADLDFVDQVAAAGVTIFVAGDDDQSIYSFRHASPLGIQRFGTKYPDEALHVLGDCFRCTPEVLQAASRVILQNQPPDRIQKQIVSLYRQSAPPNAGIVHRWRFMTADAEADAIAASCATLIAAGLAPREILVLLVNRDNRVALWPLLRDAFTAAGVPFDPPREEGFADSEGGRLVLGLLRIICSRNEDGDPEDLIAHRLVLGLRDGVGPTTCNAIREAVLSTPNVSFRDLFYDPLPNGVVRGRALTALERGREVCVQIAAWTKADTLANRRHEIAAIVRGALGDEAAGSWEGFSEPLIEDMTLSEVRDYLWVDNAQQRGDVMASVRARLNMSPNAAEAEALNRVRVMTMHGAKGLSARVVFIPAMEQGLIPNQYQAPYAAQVLEAARLVYVSITRARAACIISFARRRMVFGQSRAQNASPFAIQTGGTFVNRDEGLMPAETTSIMDAIANL
jgi:DNA helicase-2/ATP-dependent DNA helicase PcrA